MESNELITALKALIDGYGVPEKVHVDYGNHEFIFRSKNNIQNEHGDCELTDKPCDLSGCFANKEQILEAQRKYREIRKR